MRRLSRWMRTSSKGLAGAGKGHDEKERGSSLPGIIIKGIWTWARKYGAARDHIYIYENQTTP